VRGKFVKIQDANCQVDKDRPLVEPKRSLGEKAMTEPLTLAQRLASRAKTMNGSLVGASDGNTYAVGYYDQFASADDKQAADELDRLTEANKALTAKVEEAMADWSKAATNGIAEFKRAETAEAKLAKVEAERDSAQTLADSNYENICTQHRQIENITADRDRLSAELAEARQNYVDANEARLDGIRVLEKVADAHMPGRARRLAVEHLRAARSFLDSEEKP
jgi:hypothetical protein